MNRGKEMNAGAMGCTSSISERSEGDVKCSPSDGIHICSRVIDIKSSQGGMICAECSTQIAKVQAGVSTLFANFVKLL